MMLFPSISLILIIIALFVNGLKNPDPFSPAKAYFFFFIIMFADIFFNRDYSEQVYFCCFLYILLGFFLCFYEILSIKSFPLRNRHESPYILLNPSSYFYAVIFLSLIPLLNQWYIIQTLGGFSAFFVKNRLEFTWNSGALLFFTKMFVPLNLIFLLSLFIFHFKAKLKWKTVYLLFLAILILFAASTGGRTRTCIFFLYIIMAFNYFRHRISNVLFLLALVVIVPLFAIWGTVRDSMYNGFDEVKDQIVNYQVDELDDSFQYSVSRYGINPLEIIYSNNYTDFKNGSTFLSVVTNFIPRSVWPDKPDSGGVVLTKFFEGSAYLGTSHISTGLIAESIINWGYFWGPILAMLILAFFAFLIVKIYSRMLYAINNQNSFTPKEYIYRSGLYFLSLQPFINLPSGDFTVVLHSFLIPYLFFIILLKLLPVKYVLSSE